MATLSGIGIYSQRSRGTAARRRGTTAQFGAVLDALLDIRPSRGGLDFAEFACVDGLLFGRADGDLDFRHYLGPRTHLIDAVERLAAAMSISPRERAAVLLKIADIPDVDDALADEESA